MREPSLPAPGDLPRRVVAGDAGVAERLADLAHRHSLDRRQVEQLRRLLALLEEDEHAPTTVRPAARAVDLHVADSLSALDIEAVRAARSACDIGSGAGFPGLALAVALPDCHVSLLESAERKCRFLRRAAGLIEAENVSVVWTRAEQWRAGLGRHDVAVVRAVAPAPIVAEYAAPLLRRGGLLVDWRGPRRPADEEAAIGPAAQLGLELREIRPATPLPGADNHNLYLYLKVRDTPDRFPRRAGMARKHPLVGSG